MNLNKILSSKLFDEEINNFFSENFISEEEVLCEVCEIIHFNNSKCQINYKGNM